MAWSGPEESVQAIAARSGKHIDPATGIWPMAEWGAECRRGMPYADQGVEWAGQTGKSRKLSGGRRSRRRAVRAVLPPPDGKPVFGSRGVVNPDKPNKRRWAKPKPVRPEPLWDAQPIEPASEEGVTKRWTKKAPA